jgi:ERCC4-type nuclease
LDTREPAELRKWIIKQFPNLNFVEKSLKEGDILIECENEKNTKVIIERKKMDDLYGSVVGSKDHPARFPSQCVRLLTHQTNCVVVLLITGSVSDTVTKLKKYKKIDVDPGLFDSIIASVMTRYNIRVLVDPSHENGIKRAIKVGMKVCEGTLDLVAHRNCDALTARLLNITLVQWNAIRKMYGTDLTYIASADLSCINGIGKVKERRIKEVLTGKSNDWMT